MIVKFHSGTKLLRNLPPGFRKVISPKTTGIRQKRITEVDGEIFLQPQIKNADTQMGICIFNKSGSNPSHQQN